MVPKSLSCKCARSNNPMEFRFPYFLIIVVIISFFTFIFLKFKTRSNPRKSTAVTLPPGPWKFPLIGNIHNLIGDVPHRRLHDLALKYGPTMHLQLGELSTVVVSTADVAKQVMKTHDINFASRPPIMVAEIVSYGCTSITFGPYGDYWRQLRKICTLELLSVKRVQSFRSLREKVFLDLAKWIASKEGSEINLTAELNTWTYAFTATAALGKKTKEQEALIPAIKTMAKLAAGFDIAELFPSIKLLQMVSGLRRKLIRVHHEVDRILEHEVEQHKESTTVMKSHEDLLDVLLKFQGDGAELPLTNDNVKSVMLDMLSAGSETSATAIDWAMAEMVKNPSVLVKAQDEVRWVFDEEKGFVEESLVHKLEYLKAVVKETLRLHPPVPLLLPRKCVQTCEINGYQIPTETKIIVNAWAINRDPKYWENPDCFQPERFLGSSVDYKGNNFEYIPFGAGRRMCPGIAFGIANVELPIAMFLYHFDWKLGGGIKREEMGMGEGFGITAKRNKDLCVIPVIRRPLPLK
ncbi:hypothetical protein C2S52_005851 [Perilla frutescens var. hirtella]|nr:hypothetical protein C2S52_005851 [Perilla frutescens var. hirtella]